MGGYLDAVAGQDRSVVAFFSAALAVTSSARLLSDRADLTFRSMNVVRPLDVAAVTAPLMSAEVGARALDASQDAWRVRHGTGWLVGWQESAPERSVIMATETAGTVWVWLGSDDEPVDRTESVLRVIALRLVAGVGP